MARIVTRLAELKLSERQASLAATGRPDAIRYIRTRKHWPSASRLAQLAKALKTTPAYLMGAETEPGQALEAREEFEWVHRGAHELKKADDSEPTEVIPIYATVQKFIVGDPFKRELWEDDGGLILDRLEEVNFCKCPPLLRNKSNLYGIYLPDYSRSGTQVVLVDPNNAPQSRDEVVVYLSETMTSISPDLGEPIMVSRLSTQSGRKVGFLGEPLSLDADQIVRMHRIIPLKEILGA